MLVLETAKTRVDAHSTLGVARRRSRGKKSTYIASSNARVLGYAPIALATEPIASDDANPHL